MIEPFQPYGRYGNRKIDTLLRLEAGRANLLAETINRLFKLFAARVIPVGGIGIVSPGGSGEPFDAMFNKQKMAAWLK